MSDDATTQTTLAELVDSVLFHYWNCDGDCNEFRPSMARLAAHMNYHTYPGQAEEIAEALHAKI